ncbi:MAG: hypothetical protein K0R38_1625 [Polyangiaceae bacterium]|nr:hypothetical protein [Polyangiaceae bacterium]
MGTNARDECVARPSRQMTDSMARQLRAALRFSPVQALSKSGKAARMPALVPTK